ncbi:MAG: SDR family oxidoreductase [Candidatus Paceibacterota bacterium]
MRIFIAGGAGYVGSRLIPKLLERGHEIEVVDFLWFENNLPKGVKINKMDLFDIHPDKLKGFDAVVFIAGISNDIMAETSPSMNYVLNSAAPAYLAHAAKQAGVKKFVYADSCSVYGFTDNKIRTENSEAKSKYPYGISKLLGEYAVMEFNDENFSVTCLRKGTICGWSPRMRFDLIINTMYAKAMTEKKITVNNPKIWRPILAISDAVEAYTKAIEAPFKVNGIFNIHSENYTVGEIAKKIKKHFAKNHFDIDVVVNNVPDPRNYKVSSKKAEKVLKFKPKGTAESILKELDENVGKNFNFSDDRYYNIKVFNKIYKRDH